MKRIHLAWVMLGAGIVACVTLGVLLRSAQLRGAGLRAELVRLPSEIPHQLELPPPAVATATTPELPARHSGFPPAAADPELAERTALLEEARRIPEVARREAALRAIKRIQERHAASPPAPRPVPPPAPRDGPYFAELLDDPEYLDLVSQQWHLMRGAQIERRLATLDLPEEVRKKVVALEFDSYAASLDVQRYTRDAASDRSAAIVASRKLREENDAAIKAALGERGFAAYREALSPAAFLAERKIAPEIFDPLAARLSYSGQPLDSASRQRLIDLLQSPAAASTGAGVVTYSDQSRNRSGSQQVFYTSMPRTREFIDQARSILQPGQIAALEELRAEYEARQARGKLPKSSELPRTTRRERLQSQAK